MHTTANPGLSRAIQESRDLRSVMRDAAIDLTSARSRLEAERLKSERARHIRERLTSPPGQSLP